MSRRFPRMHDNGIADRIAITKIVSAKNLPIVPRFGPLQGNPL